MELVNDASLLRLDPSELPDAARNLIEWPPGSVVYREDRRSDSFWISVYRERAKYNVRIEVEAIVDGEDVDESFTIHCEPQSGAVATVHVNVTGAAHSPLSWTVDGVADEAIPTRKVPPSGGFTRTETWEINLPRPRVEPFVLRGHRRESLFPASSVSLASAPQALSQSATVMIGSADGKALSVRG